MATLGRYQMTYAAVPLANGRFYGEASFVWNEDGTTFVQTSYFDKEFVTPEQAREYARQEATLRSRAPGFN